jgi:two-component system response regulator PilR (NtrC family)
MQEQDYFPKALVIDSDPGSRKSLEEMLNEQGYQVKGVGGIGEAAPFFKDEKFSLIISELKFPGSDEAQTLELVRRLGSKVKVVLITPNLGAETYIKARAYGAFDCIDKSLEPSALREVIKLKDCELPPTF